MDVQDRVVIVTGGANGIGAALCKKFALAGVKQIVIADRDFESAHKLANELSATAIHCDVALEADIQKVVNFTQDTYGRVDIFVSNAGVTSKGGPEVPDEEWMRQWNINLMAHVYASRAVLPKMLERGDGYLVQLASAAGLLTEIGSAPYSVTKHAAVAYAEWLSVHYQKQGIKVSCVCPAGVATDFLNMEDPVHQFLHYSSVTPEQVAQDILNGIKEETFLILSQTEVKDFFAYKGTDYDKWIKNFSRLNQKIQRFAQRQQEKAEQQHG